MTTSGLDRLEQWMDTPEHAGWAKRVLSEHAGVEIMHSKAVAESGGSTGYLARQRETVIAGPSSKARVLAEAWTLETGESEPPIEAFTQAVRALHHWLIDGERADEDREGSETSEVYLTEIRLEEDETLNARIVDAASGRVEGRVTIDRGSDVEMLIDEAMALAPEGEGTVERIDGVWMDESSGALALDRHALEAQALARAGASAYECEREQLDIVMFTKTAKANATAPALKANAELAAQIGSWGHTAPTPVTVIAALGGARRLYARLGALARALEGAALAPKTHEENAHS